MFVSKLLKHIRMLIRFVTFLHATSPLWAHSVLHVLVVVCGQSISMRKNKPKKKINIQPCYEETLSLHVNPPETLNQPWMSFREGFRPTTILLPLFLKLFKLSFIFQNILRVNIRNPRVGIESNQRSKWKWNLWCVSPCGSEPVFRRMQIWHSLLLWY